MRYSVAGVMSVIALGFATPATAGDSGKEQAELRKLTYKYATCVVKKHHAKASEAILATAGNHAIVHQFPQIVDSDCLTGVAGYGVEMRFPNDTYQYAVADALVNADFATNGAASFADRLPLAQPTAMTDEQRADYLGKIKGDRELKEAQERLSKHNTLAWLLRYGECVVRKAPVDARYWLLTPPDTPEETSRIKTLQPALAACLSGGSVRFNRIVIRGVVAVNYYRLAMATPVPAAGSAS